MKRGAIKQLSSKSKTGKKNVYNEDFVAKIKNSEEDIKAGRTTKIEPGDIWKL